LCLSSKFGSGLWEYIKRVVAIGCQNDMECLIITNLDKKPPNMSSTGPFAPVFNYRKGVSRLLYGMYVWAYLIAVLKNNDNHMLWLHAARMLICLFRSCAVWRAEILEEERAQQQKSERTCAAPIEDSDSTSSNGEYPPCFLGPPAPASTRELRPRTTTGTATVAVTGAKRTRVDDSPQQSQREPSPTLVNSPRKRVRTESPASDHSGTPTLPPRPKPRPCPITKDGGVKKPFFGPKSVQDQRK
jgi:hypothetical protein